MLIFVPALVFNQATGIQINLTMLTMSVFCIFYTCIGGIKAVIWTDVVQGIVMIGSLALVAFKATFDIGGIETVVQRNLNNERIEWPE